MLKKTIVILACGALIAPVAFAQTRSTHQRQAATTTEAITVTGTVIKMTTEEGSAAKYQPVKTLVVLQDRSNTPGSYVLNGPTQTWAICVWLTASLSIDSARERILPKKSRTIPLILPLF